MRDVQDAAVTAQLLALKKTPGLGSRIDITLTLIRIGIFFGDNTLITENLAKAEKSVAPALGICGLTHWTDSSKRAETGTAGIVSRCTVGYMPSPFGSLHLPVNCYSMRFRRSLLRSSSRTMILSRLRSSSTVLPSSEFISRKRSGVVPMCWNDSHHLLRSSSSHPPNSSQYFLTSPF